MIFKRIDMCSKYQWLPHYRVIDEGVWFLDTVDTHITVPGEFSRLVEENRIFPAQQLEACIDKSLTARLLREGVMVPIQAGVPGEAKQNNNGDILVIQPHSDDFALSCGAAMAKLKFADGYQVHCLTLFSQHSVKGFPWRDMVKMDDDSYSDLRAKEDRLCLDYLSGAVTLLGYKDALCRGLHVEFLFSKDGIFKKDRALIPGMSERIGEIINQYNVAKVFLPAAVGWHYDHRLTYMAAVNALKEIKARNKKPPEIFLYEDYPYCDESRTNYWERLEELAKELQIKPLYVDAADYVDHKAVLINFYKSQLKDMNFSQIKQKMVRLAEATVIEAKFQQGNHPHHMPIAERLWQVQDFRR
jgi:LmbE family N-acetylglucosaminyl deacetylase